MSPSVSTAKLWADCLDDRLRVCVRKLCVLAIRLILLLCVFLMCLLLLCNIPIESSLIWQPLVPLSIPGGRPGNESLIVLAVESPMRAGLSLVLGSAVPLTLVQSALLESSHPILPLAQSWLTKSSIYQPISNRLMFSKGSFASPLVKMSAFCSSVATLIT